MEHSDSLHRCRGYGGWRYRVDHFGVSGIILRAAALVDAYKSLTGAEGSRTETDIPLGGLISVLSAAVVLVFFLYWSLVGSLTVSLFTTVVMTILATLGVAAVVCCATTTSGDCSQDLKTGVLVGATPKHQQMGQMIGVLIPAFVIAPILTLLHSSYGIGNGLKVPQATLFACLTQALFEDGALPYPDGGHWSGCLAD
ncbi:MAG: hypothetical protein M2R45_00027 [Verrucomicrobia subdivision 3 bacterium]|nr:hypothetical protein [Limisphaerales bacterium]MCS1412514.1 hypothetical protein [Limisphaerales bacterium]